MRFMARCVTADVVPQRSATPPASPVLLPSAGKTKQRAALTSTMGRGEDGGGLGGLGPDTGRYRLALLLTVSLLYTLGNKQQVLPRIFRQYKTFTWHKVPRTCCQMSFLKKKNQTWQVNASWCVWIRKWMKEIAKSHHTKAINIDTGQRPE